MGNPHKSDYTRDVEFKGTQILDIVFRKWFRVNSSFKIMDSKEEDELEDNSPTEVRRRNLPLSLNVQSQSAPTDMEESSNLIHLVGETGHPK